MMMSDKVFSWLATAVICSLLLTAGCAPLAEQAAKPEVKPEKRILAEPKAEEPQVVRPSEIQNLHTMAEKGDVAAQYTLARKYMHGDGVAQNYSKAARWYRKAAEQGHVQAQLTLGWMYVKGDGVGKDYDEAIRWLRKLADQNNAEAQRGLGWIYEDLEDYQEAVRWHRKAAEQGDQEAKRALVIMAMKGYDIGIDDETVVRWGKEVVKPEVAKPEVLKPEAVIAPAATLTLKFTPQDLTTYKLTTEAQRRINWEGPLPDKTAFTGGQTGNKIEMTFTRQIQTVDDKGNAVAEITIEGLKYLSIIRDNTVLDFDSSREKDKNSPMANLIGRSYTIEIAPTGKVTKVIDVKQAQAAFRGSSSAHKAALALLKPNVIKERHGTLVLPDADKNQLRTGGKWSSIKTFSFGMMGSKSYEKIYTLKEIKDTDSRRIIIVEMNAIPTSEEQLDKEVAGGFSKMFDNIETYTGRLNLDLTAGKVEKYLEKLQSEWVAVDPSAGQKDDKEPAALKMTAIRLYRLEKID